MAGDAKFKVGDRVRTRVLDFNIPAGTMGTIHSPWMGCGWHVVMDGHLYNGNDPGYFYSDNELELATAPAATPTPPPNTVPVRIAVAVWPDGTWRMEYLDPEIAGTRLSWITAHVPLPEQPAEVEGKVE